jgi:hypothetical protein
MKTSLRLTAASLIAVLFFSFSPDVAAQENVGIGTITPQENAILEIASNDKGLLVPRWNTLQRLAFIPAANPDGLLVYDIDLHQFCYWDENIADWVCLDMAGGFGATGPQGPAGSNGPAGGVGPAGADGATGTAGPTGADGAAGIAGPTGADGATGIQGPTGPVTGLTGPTGANGADGTTGPAGADGTTGPAGANGTTGPAGPAGADGTTGPDGADGTTGPAGADGTTGPDGADGTTGPAGADGTTGPAGATGAQGLPGTLGPAGADGPTGPAGPVGCATPNFVIKSNGSTAVCSQIFDNGINVAIGTTTPANYFTITRNGTGAIWQNLIENTGTGDANLQVSSANATNGSRNFLASSNASPVGFVPIASEGSWLPTGTGVAGEGVAGAVNGYEGTGVFGSRFNDGGLDAGWGGLFLADLGYTGGLFNASDKRLKRDIRKIENATDLILQIKGVNYEHRLDEYPNMGLGQGLQYGFIAQELEAVIPELVQEKLIDTQGTARKSAESKAKEDTKELFKTVNYVALIPVLVEAIKEQEARIKELEARLLEQQK